MGQVSTKFTGDPQQLLSAYQQLYAANVKLQEQHANTARESTRQRNEVGAHIVRELGSLKGLVGGYASLTSAVSFVSGAYTEWRDRITEIVAKTREANAELTRQISLAGHAVHAGDVEKALASIPGATKADALAAYRGITSGTDYKVDYQRQLALARAVAPAGSLGLQETDIEQLAVFVGQLATVDADAPAEKLFSKALQIQSQAGTHFDKLRGAKVGQAIRQLVAHNIPEDYAWGLAIEAASQDAPQLIAQLAAAATGPFEKPQTKGRTRLTPEEAAKTKFAAAGVGEERLALLLSDPVVAQAVMPGQSDLINRLDQDAAFKLGISLLEGRGTFEDLSRGLAGSRAGREFSETRELVAAERKAMRDTGAERQQADYERAQQILATVLAERGANPIERKWRMAGFSFDTIADQAGLSTYPNGFTPESWNLYLRGGEEAVRRFAESTNAIDGPRFDSSGRLLERTNDLLQQILERIDVRQPAYAPAPVNNLNER
jgi:hypothetical protein